MAFAVAGGRSHGCNCLSTNVNASISTLSDGLWQKGERNTFINNSMRVCVFIVCQIRNESQTHRNAFNVGSYTDGTETKNVFFVADFVFFFFFHLHSFFSFVQRFSLLHKTEKLLDEQRVLRENTMQITSVINSR